MSNYPVLEFFAPQLGGGNLIDNDIYRAILLELTPPSNTPKIELSSWNMKDTVVICRTTEVGCSYW
jgi:hypothetical protein